MSAPVSTAPSAPVTATAPDPAKVSDPVSVAARVPVTPAAAAGAMATVAAVHCSAADVNTPGFSLAAFSSRVAELIEAPLAVAAACVWRFV
jgi:hypothetical protein